ncbi:hypothetical protein HZS_3251 [Henneguya salminicola]|nr:hypothetical protein HZS_3251 [Henneguya salminicola]
MKSKNLFNNSFLNHLSNLLLGLSIDFDILESNFERKVVCHIFNDPTISICELIKKFQEFEPQSTLDRIYNCLIKRDFCDFFQTVE